MVSSAVCIFTLGIVFLGCSDLNFVGFYIVSNIGAKCLTFRRGSEVSPAFAILYGLRHGAQNLKQASYVCTVTVRVRICHCLPSRRLFRSLPNGSSLFVEAM